MQKVTIDIRDSLGDGFAESNLEALIQEQRDFDREVTEIFCTHAQAKTIGKFVTKKKDAKGKVTEVKTFDGIKLQAS